MFHSPFRKFVKATTGYDLTQLVIGSEGTLAIVTEAVLKIYPRPQHSATILVPFASVDEIASAVPHIVRSGVNPLVLEYVDGGTLARKLGGRPQPPGETPSP